MRKPDFTDAISVGSIVLIGGIGYFFGRGQMYELPSGMVWAFVAALVWVELVIFYGKRHK